MTDTRTVPIKGRDITVRQITDVQWAVLAREAALTQKDAIPTARKVEGLGRAFDIIESAIVGDGDREYVLNLVVSGEVDLEGLRPIMTAFRDDVAEPVKAVRRGRPPKRLL